MKRFKFLLLTLFVITGAGVLFAFNSKKQDSSPKEKMFSVVYYTYTPVSPATNPPSSSNDVTTTGNWTSVGGAPTNCGSPVTPNKICYITFDTGCGYDTKDKLLTVKSNTNPRVYQLGFEDIEDEDKRQEFFLNLDFTVEKLK